MPGLVGLITKLPRERAEAALLGMVAAIRHETWYTTGTWSDPSLGLYIGWVERSQTSADQMPLHDEHGNRVLVFSGEEFSIGGTAGRFSPLHRSVQDDHFLRSLNGTFHGILINKAAATATLFNDRYGMGRLYYHQANDAFYFAAEAKAILAVRPELRSIDEQGLADFISCGCTLANRTLFKQISLLPGASAWVFNQSTHPREASYFEPKEWEEQTTLDPETYYQHLREVFSESVPRYLEGAERVGISLTGGLDSRMIMAWSKAAARSFPCYSFGGMFRDSQDVVVARKVAQACGQTHEVISVGNEFLTEFPHYSERTVFLTDGCVEVKHAPDLYVNERARLIAPVRITGNYGGEVLRRVRAFRPVDPQPGLYRSEMLSAFGQSRKTYNGFVNDHPLSFAVFRQAPWHHYGLHSLEESQLSMRSPFLDNNVVKTVYSAPQQSLTSDAISVRLIEDGSRSLSRIRTDRGVGGALPRWIAAAQRAWLDFTFKAEYAYDYGMPQAVVNVDYALSSLHLERLFLGRHKFYHYRVWYRDALAQYVREMLLDSRALSRPYLNRDVVEEIVSGHTDGTRNATATIHKLLTLEYVHRLFID